MDDCRGAEESSLDSTVLFILVVALRTELGAISKTLIEVSISIEDTHASIKAVVALPFGNYRTRRGFRERLGRHAFSFEF